MRWTWLSPHQFRIRPIAGICSTKESSSSFDSLTWTTRRNTTAAQRLILSWFTSWGIDLNGPVRGQPGPSRPAFPRTEKIQQNSFTGAPCDHLPQPTSFPAWVGLYVKDPRGRWEQPSCLVSIRNELRAWQATACICLLLHAFCWWAWLVLVRSDGRMVFVITVWMGSAQLLWIEENVSLYRIKCISQKLNLGRFLFFVFRFPSSPSESKHWPKRLAPIRISAPLPGTGQQDSTPKPSRKKTVQQWGICENISIFSKLISHRFHGSALPSPDSLENAHTFQPTWNHY